jgi:glutaminase
MASKGSFPTDIPRTLDFYFQMCSMDVTNRVMANIASTYANYGINPISHKKCLSQHTVKRTMQVI